MITPGIPGWVKVIAPAVLALAGGVAGASWHQAVSNEHRLTTSESAAGFLAKTVDTTLARQLAVEQKFDLMQQALGRIEGAIAERNRAEALPPRPRK